MQSFLDEVVLALKGKYSSDLSSVTVVMPTSRSRSYFSAALRRGMKGPAWEPSYMSMDQIAQQITSLSQASDLRLLVELYAVYSSHFKSETFDSFYYWGVAMLEDFNDVDSAMADAQQLFGNIRDLKQIDAGMDYLTEEQKALLRRFHVAVSESAESGLTKDFLGLWEKMYSIYSEFRTRLLGLGIASHGMILREAAQRLREGTDKQLDSSAIAFIGFDLMSQAQQALVSGLQKKYDVSIFWDYDDYYVNDSHNEAGRGLRSNFERLGRGENISHSNFRLRPQVSVYSTGGKAIQCKQAVSVLCKIAQEANHGSTAVVLTDESLLMPMIYSLPESVGAVNVTMGYKLRSSLAYSLVDRLLFLQSRARKSDGITTFYHKDVTGLLMHPYLSDMVPAQAQKIIGEIRERKLYNVPSEIFSGSELLERVFFVQEGASALLHYVRDVLTDLCQVEKNDTPEQNHKVGCLQHLAVSVARLENIIQECAIELSPKVCASVLRRHLQGERVQFAGEDLSAIQLTTMFDTQCADFDNVIILSMEDDNFPGSHVSDVSFIPYSLRYAFSLASYESQESRKAYMFYRLLQRAKQVHLIYSSKADDKSTGEQSRFIRQIEYEAGINVSYYDVSAPICVGMPQEVEQPKDEYVKREFEKFYLGKRDLSPSAISTYIECPMQFYYKYLASMKVEEELEDAVDNSTFGTILHGALEKIYKKVIGIRHPGASLRMLSEAEVAASVESAIGDVCFSGSEKVVLDGELQVIKSIVIEYVTKMVMAYDISHDDFTVEAVERSRTVEFELDAQRRILLKGKADRLDKLDNGHLRIVDYKTGNPGPSNKKYWISSLESLFDVKTCQENSFNTLLYSMIFRITENEETENEETETEPALYYVRKMKDSQYEPQIRIADKPVTAFSELHEEFSCRLKALLCELFDTERPFVCRPVDETCIKRCKYRTLCGR